MLRGNGRGGWTVRVPRQCREDDLPLGSPTPMAPHFPEQQYGYCIWRCRC